MTIQIVFQELVSNFTSEISYMDTTRIPYNVKRNVIQVFIFRQRRCVSFTSVLIAQIFISQLYSKSSKIFLVFSSRGFIISVQNGHYSSRHNRLSLMKSSQW